MIVADASLLANLLIPGLDQVSAEAVQKRDSDWRAPGLWHYEFRNVVLKYIRAGVLTQEIGNNLVTHAVSSMGNAWKDAPSFAVVATAVACRISSYDAEYVALAQSLGVPLVTYDRKLARSAAGIAFLHGDYLSQL